jgi:hypothetical protein
MSRRSFTPVWSLATATFLMSDGGANAMSSADARPSWTTVTLRSLSVSSASGVMCPPRASITVSPGTSTRASLSVRISNFFIEV